MSCGCNRIKQEWEPSQDAHQARVLCWKSKYPVGKKLREGNCKDKVHRYADIIENVIQVVSNRCITTRFPNVCISEDIS